MSVQTVMVKLFFNSLLCGFTARFIDVSKVSCSGEKKSVTGPDASLHCSTPGSKFLFTEAGFHASYSSDCRPPSCQALTADLGECYNGSGRCNRRFDPQDVHRLYRQCNSSTATPCRLDQLATKLSQNGQFDLLYYCTKGTPMDPCAARSVETTDLYHSFSASTDDRQCQCTMKPTSRTDGQFNFEYLYFAYPVCSQGPLSNTVTFKSGKTEKTLNETSLVTRASLSELSIEDPKLELNLRFFGTACTSEGLVWFHFPTCMNITCNNFTVSTSERTTQPIELKATRMDPNTTTPPPVHPYTPCNNVTVSSMELKTQFIEVKVYTSIALGCAFAIGLFIVAVHCLSKRGSRGRQTSSKRRAVGLYPKIVSRTSATDELCLSTLANLTPYHSEAEDAQAQAPKRQVHYSEVYEVCNLERQRKNLPCPELISLMATPSEADVDVYDKLQRHGDQRLAAASEGAGCYDRVVRQESGGSYQYLNRGPRRVVIIGNLYDHAESCEQN